MSVGIRPVFYRIPAVRPLHREDDRPGRRRDEAPPEPRDEGAPDAESEDDPQPGDDAQAPRRHIDVRV